MYLVNFRELVQNLSQEGVFLNHKKRKNQKAKDR